MIWRTAALSGIDPGEKGMLLHFESAKCHPGGLDCTSLSMNQEFSHQVYVDAIVFLQLERS